jgi:hypothetical protein
LQGTRRSLQGTQALQRGLWLWASRGWVAATATGYAAAVAGYAASRCRVRRHRSRASGSWALVRVGAATATGYAAVAAGYAPQPPPLAGHPVGASVVSGPPRGPRPAGALRATKRVRLVVGSRFLNFAIQNSFAEIGSHRTKSDWRASL